MAYWFSGKESVRPFWSQYFEGTHGLLFVVDASAGEESLRFAKDTLREVLSQATLKGRPCVVLATHADIASGDSSQQVTSLATATTKALRVTGIVIHYHLRARQRGF